MTADANTPFILLYWQSVVGHHIKNSAAVQVEEKLKRLLNVVFISINLILIWTTNIFGCTFGISIDGNTIGKGYHLGSTLGIKISILIPSGGLNCQRSVSIHFHLLLQRNQKSASYFKVGPVVVTLASMLRWFSLNPTLSIRDSEIWPQVISILSNGLESNLQKTPCQNLKPFSCSLENRKDFSNRVFCIILPRPFDKLNMTRGQGQ